MQMAWLLSGGLAAGSLLSGCSHTVRAQLDRDFSTATVRTALTGTADRRARFQRLFCDKYVSELPSHDPGRACREWIWSPAGAPAGSVGMAASAPPSEPAALPAHRTLIVIPGIFGECVSRWVTPFSHDHAHLETLGYRVRVIKVKGRASSAHNAGIIRQFMGDPDLDLDGAVVLAYSKGVNDFMLAASQPGASAWRDRLAALISVAGSVNGSPVANRGQKLHDAMLAKLPLSECGPEDGGGVRSLTYREALPAAAAFAAAAPGLKTYSIVAVTGSRSVNPVLYPFHQFLLGMDERNDGQVLLEDAVVPGSEVLGIFRADHWSIALPFAQSTAREVKALRANNSFPRRALVTSLLQFTAPVAPRPSP